MPTLSSIYHVKENLRGITKDGYCRPTIAEFWDPDVEYVYIWCRLRPIYDIAENVVYDNSGNMVMI